LAVTIIPVRIRGDIRPKDRLDSVITRALDESGIGLQDGDIVVVAQKIVSKAEGRVIGLGTVRPSAQARRLARQLKKDPRMVELILQESREIVKMKNGIIITETRHGLVCANSGVDQSNVASDDSAVLLPADPDKSARRLRGSFMKKGRDVAVLITDTFGRPFREGQANVAIGVAGIKPIKSYVGKKDMFGKELRVTEIAVADEIASAAELVMGKSRGVPVAIVRGYSYEKAQASSRPLVRKKKNDLFRHQG
jgi:coenzyme F420-0:L-glutamate ligase/coenzyme F420-1:gamma-L-glutamate ligase